jgi:hypothetical protein
MVSGCGDLRVRRDQRVSSSTCSTESTISFTNSNVTPGMTRSASVKARCRLLKATRASCEDTRGKS